MENAGVAPNAGSGGFPVIIRKGINAQITLPKWGVAILEEMQGRNIICKRIYLNIFP